MSPSLEDQLGSYLQAHADDGILLDTNVLLLLLISQFDSSFIGRDRLKGYDQRDAQLLADYVKHFKRILTTPHVLAETSNFARQMIKGRAQINFFERLYPLFCTEGEQGLTQAPVSGGAIDRRLFVRLGLTDSALVASVNTKRLLLTADLDLHVATVTQGGHSINFTHMREAAGFL